MKEVDTRLNGGGGHLKGAGPGNHCTHRYQDVYVWNNSTTYPTTHSLLHPPTNQTL